MDDEWWWPALREVFDGRDVIVAGSVAAAWTDYVELLRTAGAERIMIAATEGRGAGDVADVPTVIIEPPVGSTMMERIHFEDHIEVTDHDPLPEGMRRSDRPGEPEA